MVKAVTQTAPDVEIGWSRRRHASRRRSGGVRHNKLNNNNIMMLRCCPSVDNPLLDRYDVLLRKGLSSILNIDMTDDQWTQASLPIKLGGLGIRRAASL